MICQSYNKIRQKIRWIYRKTDLHVDTKHLTRIHPMVVCSFLQNVKQKLLVGVYMLQHTINNG